MTRDFLPNIMAECQPVSIPYVMIVESDPELAAMLQNALKYEMKIGTMFADTVGDALNIARALCPVLFLINSHLLGGSGLMLIDQLHQNSILASVPTILLTTNICTDQPEAVERSVTCLPIPNELDYLLSAIKEQLSPHAVEEDQMSGEAR